MNGDMRTERLADTPAMCTEQLCAECVFEEHQFEGVPCAHRHVITHRPYARNSFVRNVFLKNTSSEACLVLIDTLTVMCTEGFAVCKLSVS